MAVAAMAISALLALPHEVLAGCCASTTVIVGEESVLFISMNVGTEQRVVKVCQGGGPPSVTYDIYWCLCDEPQAGTNCNFSHTTSNDAGTPNHTDSGCALTGSPPSGCRIGPSGCSQSGGGGGPL